MGKSKSRSRNNSSRSRRGASGNGAVTASTGASKDEVQPTVDAHTLEDGSHQLVMGSGSGGKPVGLDSLTPEEADRIGALVSDEPSRLAVGGGGSGKTVIMSDESLADLEPLIAELLKPLALEQDDTTQHDVAVAPAADPSIDDVLGDTVEEVDENKLVPWDVTFDDGPVLVVHSILDDDSVVRSAVRLSEDDAKRLVALSGKVERYYNGERKFLRRMVDWSFLHPIKASALGLLLIVAVGALISGL